MGFAGSSLRCATTQSIAAPGSAAAGRSRASYAAWSSTSFGLSCRSVDSAPGGSGTASVLAQAQYFASQPPESREKTLLFATFDSHFTGYQGHMAFVDKYIVRQETPYRIVANITLEHVGKQVIGIAATQAGLRREDQAVRKHVWRHRLHVIRMIQIRQAQARTPPAVPVIGVERDPVRFDRQCREVQRRRELPKEQAAHHRPRNQHAVRVALPQGGPVLQPV
mgnify:CR=1 FL=1